MIYLFDFDGTIINVWRRYHFVFCRSADIDLSRLSMEQYRELRRQGKRDADIFNLLKGTHPDADFYSKKQRLLESSESLAMDSLLISPLRLCHWFSSHCARIITMRRRRDLFLEQLDQLSISDLADKATVLNPDKVKSKWDWVEHNLDYGEGVKMFGDSEVDMAVGRLTNSSAVFVDTGLFGWCEIASSCPWCEYAESLSSALDREDALNNGVQGS